MSNMKELQALWYQKHKKEIKIRNGIYRKANPEVELRSRAKHRKQKALQVKLDARETRQKALKILGGKCVRCQFSDWRALHIDHVNGRGYEERAMVSPQSLFRRIARGNIEGYQILCANCNFIKFHENQEMRRGSLYD